MSSIDTLSGRNRLFNFIGLLMSLILYSNYKNDPSMTGWYFTFGIIPIVLIPIFNRLLLERNVFSHAEKPAGLYYFLIFPVLFLLVLVLSKELIILLMLMSISIVNLVTYFVHVRKNKA